MKKTTFENWKVVPNNNIELSLPYHLFETESSEYVLFFKEIEEWGLLKYWAGLEIYKNKESPVKIYDSNSVGFIINLFDNQDNYIFDLSINKLVFLRQISFIGPNKYEFPYVLINLENLTFTKLNDVNNLKSEYFKDFGLLSQDLLKIKEYKWKSLSELK